MHASFPASISDRIRTNLLSAISSALTLLLLCTTTIAQTTTLPKVNDWERVKFFSPGKKIHVNTKAKDHTDCSFISADDTTLKCGGATFQRADITSIKSSHRTRSTFVGLGAGYVAAGVVTAVGTADEKSGINPRCNSIGCAFTIAVVDLTLIIATPIVFHITDLTATTLYKAPTP